MRIKKDNLINLALVLVFVAGLSLVLYPSVSNYWNARHQTKAISNYSEVVASISKEEYDAEWNAAMEFNRNIENRPNRFIPSEKEQQEYHDILNFSGNGVMGYIEIPAIDVSLPVYHGTSDTVLQNAIGHLDWTSLPVGGEGTHCVLSGHRGLPSAKLFTHLDKLIEGDTFMLRVLDEVLTYEVDKISIVEPQDTGDLLCEKGKDYCTLVTCTPYGINTHRLLVRGHRIETVQQAAMIHITAEAVQIEPVIITAVVGIPMLVLMMIVTLFTASGNAGSALPAERKGTHAGIKHGKSAGFADVLRAIASVRFEIPEFRFKFRLRRRRHGRRHAHVSRGAHSRKD